MKQPTIKTFLRFISIMLVLIFTVLSYCAYLLHIAVSPFEANIGHEDEFQKNMDKFFEKQNQEMEKMMKDIGK